MFEPKETLPNEFIRKRSFGKSIDAKNAADTSGAKIFDFEKKYYLLQFLNFPATSKSWKNEQTQICRVQ